MNYDIFNGDADGIISLLQLRFAEPKESVLVTGVKRKIALLGEIDVAPDDDLTVLDISMAKNAGPLRQALRVGARVFYVDHHQSGEIPEDGRLTAHINPDPDMCTALIVDELLDGQYHDWAITAAYGDNLNRKADALASAAGFSDGQRTQLQSLGVLINYNGYGEKEADLLYHPAELYRALSGYRSPFDVIDDKQSPFYRLETMYDSDMALATAQSPLHQSDILHVYQLADTASSRRVSGVFGNWLANQAPDRAHAVFTLNPGGDFTVSLRAPLNNKQGAGDICSQFPTGGGRSAAAGINALPVGEIESFIMAVESYYTV
jgi:hypothetical protein